MSTRTIRWDFVSIVPGAKRLRGLRDGSPRRLRDHDEHENNQGGFREHRARREAPFVVCGTDPHDGFAITMSTKTIRWGFVSIVPGAKRPRGLWGRITTTASRSR